MFKKLKNKVNSAAVSAECAISRALTNRRGEGYVDTGVKILIAVVLGALLLGLLYALLKTTIMGTVTTKISSLFGYTG